MKCPFLFPFSYWCPFHWNKNPKWKTQNEFKKKHLFNNWPIPLVSTASSVQKKRKKHVNTKTRFAINISSVHLNMHSEYKPMISKHKNYDEDQVQASSVLSPSFHTSDSNAFKFCWKLADCTEESSSLATGSDKWSSTEACFGGNTKRSKSWQILSTALWLVSWGAFYLVSLYLRLLVDVPNCVWTWWVMASLLMFCTHLVK